MEFIRELLKEKSGELIGQLTERVGLDMDVAERFLPLAGSATLDAVKARASSLDLDQLASASNVAELSSAIDTESIAREVGIPADQASEGITAILPTILGFLSAKVGGAGGLIGLLGAHGEVGANRNLGGALEKLKGLSGRF